MNKRQEAALETRQKIISVVKELIDEKDANSISIEEITTRANVAKGTFYTYFKRKEDVISEIALLEFEVLKDMVGEYSGDVYAQICCYLNNSVKIIEKNTLQVAQQWMKSVAAPLDEEKAGIQKYTYDYDNILKLLSSAIDSHELQDDTPIPILTEMIMNNYYGAVVSWCINKGNQGQLEDSIQNYCLYGLKCLIEKYKN